MSDRFRGQIPVPGGAWVPFQVVVFLATQSHSKPKSDSIGLQKGSVHPVWPVKAKRAASLDAPLVLKLGLGVALRVF